MTQRQSKHYIGLMSGTSLDGLDIALCTIDDRHNLQLVKFTTAPMPSQLRQSIAELSHTSSLPLIGQIDRQFALYCAEQVNTFLQTHGLQPSDIAAIGSHGQTVWHSPHSHPSFTVQLGCPSTLAADTGINVVAHFRQKDIALGGQGAPLAPAFHGAMLSKQNRNLAVINLGGIANISIIDGNGNTIGYDTGPANCLLDEFFQANHVNPNKNDHHFDLDGNWGRQGKVVPDLLKNMLNDPYFSQPAPKSSGREYFNTEWVNSQLSALSSRPAAVDIQRTLYELTAHTISTELQRYQIEHAYLSGGGMHNTLLCERLAALSREMGSDISFSPSDDAGLPGDAMEAMAFAWLAWCYCNRQPANLPAVTGASRETILGGLYYS